MRRRSRAIAIASSGANITRFQATIGKLQTTLCAEPTARQISASEPSSRVRVNVVLLPGSSFSIVSCNRRVNWPTPQCICGPAPRNSARYRVSPVIVRRRVSRSVFKRSGSRFALRKRAEINTGVSHTCQTLASGKRRRLPGTVLANPTMKIVRPSHNGTSGGHAMAAGRDFGTAGIGGGPGNAKSAGARR